MTRSNTERALLQQSVSVQLGMGSPLILLMTMRQVLPWDQSILKTCSRAIQVSNANGRGDEAGSLDFPSSEQGEVDIHSDVNELKHDSPCQVRAPASQKHVPRLKETSKSLGSARAAVLDDFLISLIETTRIELQASP